MTPPERSGQVEVGATIAMVAGGGGGGGDSGGEEGGRRGR